MTSLAIQKNWTKKKPIIAVDFDGTIMEHTLPYPSDGPEVSGAVYWLQRFRQLDASLILWTVRADDPEQPKPKMSLTHAMIWCRKRGLEFDTVNILDGQHHWSASPKAHADIYIDDAAAGCPLLVPASGGRPVTDWRFIGPMVEAVLIERLQFPKVNLPVPHPEPFFEIRGEILP